jgi:hypothetical protein
MSARTEGTAGVRRGPQHGGRHRQQPRSAGGKAASAGTGRRMAAGLAGVGSAAALAGAGIAMLASPGSVPSAAPHTGQSGVQAAALTVSLGGAATAAGGGSGQAAVDPANVAPNPTPPIQVSPAPQRAGTVTFSGGGGVSVPFNTDTGLGPPSFFGLLNATPPPLGGLSTGGSLPLNFSSSASAPATSQGPSGSASLPSIFDMDPAYSGLANTIAQQQNNASVQGAADQGQQLPASRSSADDSGVQVASDDPLQAFALAAAKDPNVADSLGAGTGANTGDSAASGVQLAQNNQPTTPNPSVTLTYPDGSSQTFPVGPSSNNPLDPPTINGGGQLFAPLGSTITLPSGNTIQLNEPGLMQVVPPDMSMGAIPVYVLPMDKIPMAGGTDGTTNTALTGSDRSVVADASSASAPDPGSSDTASSASAPDPGSSDTASTASAPVSAAGQKVTYNVPLGGSGDDGSS